LDGFQPPLIRTIMIGNRYISSLLPEERITIVMASVLDLLILSSGRPEKAFDLFLLNLGIILVVFLTAIAHDRFRFACFQPFRDWYAALFLLVIFFENRRLIPLVNPHDLDGLFIRIDRFLFLGNDPTVLLGKIASPLLSEVLQVTYASFYFLPFTLCLIVYLTRERAFFHVVASTILAGFFVSFLGYYLTPVLGPRYSLDYLQNAPLQGLLLFDPLRELLSLLEGVMRDCCPSGHALISLLSALLAWRYSPRFFPTALIWALLIYISTVYLRYHYVADLIAGTALCLPVYHFCPGFAGRLIRRHTAMNAGT
jgi:membrane-associated phospholipid phosphatase